MLKEKRKWGKNRPWLGPVGEKNRQTCSIYIPGVTLLGMVGFIPLFVKYDIELLFQDISYSGRQSF